MSPELATAASRGRPVPRSPRASSLLGRRAHLSGAGRHAYGKELLSCHVPGRGASEQVKSLHPLP